ncbi:NAD kinase [Flavobacteriaceae bacterium]|nr:NAD kinase [Flavobacteriaceae bacterium]
MNIAIYSAFFSPETLTYIRTVIAYLESHQHNISLVNRLKKYMSAEQEGISYFSDDEILASNIDFLFSIGGDGTLLRSITIVRDSKIPIFGINTGRLGFLTSLHRDVLTEGLDLFFKKKYTFIKRSLLEVSTKNTISALEKIGFALNEVSINRKNTTSMLSIKAELDGKHLTTYWADGLIVSTPTGSTGYSLSNGGPIVSPDSACWILNPIAPHNINMRPLIVTDSTAIKISVDGRDKNHLLSLDSRILTIENGNDIYLKKAAFSIQTVQLEGAFFFDTLREKLFWGQDSRNTQ